MEMSMSIRTGSERGFVLVLFAFMLVGLLGFAALAVDLGMMYAAHTSAQQAADAAALAGAYTFITAGPNATDAALTTQATAQATDTVIRNGALGIYFKDTELTPAINVEPGPRRVTVSLSHVMDTYFAGVLNQKFATVSVVAVAEAGPKANCTGCIKPWFIPNNVLAPRTGPASGCGACTNNQALIIDPNTGDTTQFAKDNMNNEFTLHPAGPEGALSPGDYLSIVLPNDNFDIGPGSPGGNAYRDNIALCRQAASVKCGDEFQVKPGRMVGPTDQGTSLFISFYQTDKWHELDGYRDSWAGAVGGIPYYNGPAPATPPAMEGTGKTSSHQLATAPIWDVCTQYCPAGELGQGRNTWVKIVGFAEIFIADVKNNADVTAYIVSVSGCGGNPAPCGGSSVMGYPLRLVRMD
jgi:hypothetical protein